MNHNTLNIEDYGLTLYVMESGKKADTPKRKDIAIARLEQDINFKSHALDTYAYEGWSAIHHDLLVVSAAIEYADRKRSRRIGKWARSLNLKIPVLEIGIWQRKEVQAKLKDALQQLTGDKWEFSFIKWEGHPISASRQRSLPFIKSREFAIAYSDGLDSRCVSEIYGQGDVAAKVRFTNKRGAPILREEPFDQIPFEVKTGPTKESSRRTRGFKFAALTAIAAQLSGLQRIIVPESGQGALGPVLLPLHNIYPDYRNHPAFFRKMEIFISTILAHNVQYQQPRLWSTKGETIKVYLNVTGKSKESLIGTRSCWQERWNHLGGEQDQCGLCAACLLRRLSMHAAGIQEPPESYAFSDLSVSDIKDSVSFHSPRFQYSTMLEYGSVGARHLHQLAAMASLPDRDLQVHAFQISRTTGICKQESLENLRELLTKHATEWEKFISYQGHNSFLKNWIQGGRYVYPE